MKLLIKLDINRTRYNNLTREIIKYVNKTDVISLKEIVNISIKLDIII